MCIKLRYCNRDIDDCIKEEIKKLNEQGIKTVSSCCGHGLFNKTIIFKNEEGKYYEYFSTIRVFPEKKRYLNFYKGKWIKEHHRRYYYLEDISDR